MLNNAVLLMRTVFFFHLNDPMFYSKIGVKKMFDHFDHFDTFCLKCNPAYIGIKKAKKLVARCAT